MTNQIKAFNFITLYFIIGLFTASELSAQYYEFSLNQRRRFDQLHVEVWVKSINEFTPGLGNATLYVRFNPSYLSPSESQDASRTDTVNKIVNTSNPIDDIHSEYHSSNGYNSLGTSSISGGYFSIEVNLKELGKQGIVPSNTGRGSFIGKFILDIVNNPPDDSLSGVEWSKSNLPGDVRVFDVDGNDLSDQSVLTDPGDFTVVGLTLLSPNFSGQTVDRNQDYASLTGDYEGGGYPIYFERSVNPGEYTPPETSPPAIDPKLAYMFEYSIDGGDSWTEFGRVTETDIPSSSVGSREEYLSGDIFNPNSLFSYTITNQHGDRITKDNYRNPVRVIWAKNSFFAHRSEEAWMKVTLLEGDKDDDIIKRARKDIFDISDMDFVFGRLFFVQLDGITQYFKTSNNYSNSTQLTVEAWVNLNGDKGIGSETGILVSSAGPDATQIYGSTEGAWMLYLKDGRYPAFRVRELLGRGDNGYLASISAYDPLPLTSDARPLSKDHSDNWVHIAATVNNNTVTLYVNGEIVNRTVNTDATDMRMMTNTHPVWIGINPNDEIDNTDYLHAGMKEVRVWRNALTQEQIRTHTPGVVDPENIEDYGDMRRALDMYFQFKGSKGDAAFDVLYQDDANDIDFYNSSQMDNLAIVYRPDSPHLRMTAPVSGNGVINTEDEIFEIRWVSFGIGDITLTGSNDIDIDYSTDDGNTWFRTKDSSESENISLDIERGRQTWEPYLNTDIGGNLRTIDPFSREVVLRINGTVENTQSGLTFVSDVFTVAPYFALKRFEGSIVVLPESQGMNITGNTAFIEAWIRPYRFPNDNEGFFPIAAKYDSVNNVEHYSLRILPTGQLQFNVTDIDGTVRTASSDLTNVLQRPNSVALDTPWTHVAVYAFLNNGSGSSDVRFYLDGNVQRATEISSQLGDDISVDILNDFPLYIGYYPTGGGNTIGFSGEIREVRFWNEVPNGVSVSGAEPTELTRFVQGALTVRSGEIDLSYRRNLFSAFSFNGSSFVNNGYWKSLSSSTRTSHIARFDGIPVSYVPVKPYLKLVEPVFRQEVANSKEDLRVRWVGFDYDGEGFRTGTASQPPSLEFSIRGGGGNIIQPYQYVGSTYWVGNNMNSMSFPNDEDFLYDKSGENIYIASSLNVTIADPDENDDGVFFDQGPLSASLTNARLRIGGQYTIFGETRAISSEGPLFSITPASNFTIRVLLEGYHNGRQGGNIKDLASTFDQGGLRIKLYSDNAGIPGELIDSAESEDGYDDINPDNRKGGNNRFANVNFVFTDITDGYYWVVLEHINHLPVMSRFAAPLIYEGDLRYTWRIESGWDFESWDGRDNNVLGDISFDPWEDNSFTAFGDAVNTREDPLYFTTGLVFNNGVAGMTQAAMPGMVAGDVERDGQINAADRVQVRKDDGTGQIRSDVTGDGIVNADDRTIVDRNFGKVSSIYQVDLQQFPIDSPVNGKGSNNEITLRNNNNRNEKIYVLDKFKNNKDEILDFIKYNVYGEAKINEDFVDLSLYIKNEGDPFAPANCTFAVKYNSSMLNFIGLIGEDSVIFSDDEDRGYAMIKSAPAPDAQNPIPDVRTIEIDYDAYLNPDGTDVPSEKTYLGTLRFDIKTGNSIIEFEWHESTSVHATDGRIVTEYGIFNDILPILMYSAEVDFPNGGESFAPSETISVYWKSDSKALINLEYSTNGGFNWSKINTDPLIADSRSHEWTLPGISSSECLVRVVDHHVGIELDRSNDYFSILPNFAQIIRPGSGDPIYEGDSQDEIRWVSQGYSRIRFEFSSDGGINWEDVTQNIGASSGQVNWRIPNISTKDAIVRMIDSRNEEIITQSGKFKILKGSITFREPRAGDEWIVGRSRRIRWSAELVDIFDLDLSVDGGNTWNRITTDQETIRGYKDWDVLNLPTDKAVFRAIWNNDPEMEYDRTTHFTIKIISSVNDVLPSGYIAGMPAPNPTSGNIFMEITVPHDQKCKIKIINEIGEFVSERPDKYLTNGKNNIYIQMEDLTPGTYYIVFQSENILLLRDIVIIR